MAENERHNFSIRSLFLLIAVVAVLLSLLLPLRDALDVRFRNAEAAAAAAFGAFSMMLVAMMLGAVLTPRRPRFALSALVGLLVGALLGPVLAVTYAMTWQVQQVSYPGLFDEPTIVPGGESEVSEPFLSAMIATCLAGSALLCVLALIFRQSARTKSEPSTNGSKKTAEPAHAGHPLDSHEEASPATRDTPADDQSTR